MNRDRQRSAVYAWERKRVSPHDRSVVPFNQIEFVVHYIWEQEGLSYPPLVKPLPKQAHNAGDATRTVVRFSKRVPTWMILHELAHAMTSTVDGRSNEHGALFMGVFCKLLHKYLKMDFDELVMSAELAGLKVQPAATPVFLRD